MPRTSYTACIDNSCRHEQGLTLSPASTRLLLQKCEVRLLSLTVELESIQYQTRMEEGAHTPLRVMHFKRPFGGRDCASSTTPTCSTLHNRGATSVLFLMKGAADETSQKTANREFGGRL